MSNQSLGRQTKIRMVEVLAHSKGAPFVYRVGGKHLPRASAIHFKNWEGGGMVRLNLTEEEAKFLKYVIYKGYRLRANLPDRTFKKRLRVLTKVQDKLQKELL